MTRKQYEQQRYFNRVQRAAARALDLATTMTFREMAADLFRCFKEVEEYRGHTPQHSAALLLAIVVIGLLSSENNVRNIETFIKNNPDKVKEYLKMAGINSKLGMPSDSTLLRALHHVDYLDLLAIVSEWSDRWFASSSKYRHIAIDGKALRACLKKCFCGTHPPYILNAFDVDSGCFHAQIEIGKKTNEIGEIYHLLSLMDLDGTFITGDAAFSHADAMRAVVQAGGHMACPVKGNQPNLEETIRAYIDDMRIEASEHIAAFSDEDNGVVSHGRKYWRYYEFITKGVDELLAETDFSGLGHAVAVVRRFRQDIRYDDDHNPISSPVEAQTVYYVIDTASISVEEFARYVRNHWAGCEIVHYVLDTEFDEDLSRVCTGNGMQNLSILRKACMTILKAIRKNTKQMSYHAIRQTLRDLGGIPVDFVKTTANTSSSSQADKKLTG